MSIADILAAKRAKTQAVSTVQATIPKEDQRVASVQEEHEKQETESNSSGDTGSAPAFSKPSDALLRDYHSIEELRASPVWKILGIRDRLLIAGRWKELNRRRDTSNTPAIYQAPAIDHPSQEDLKKEKEADKGEPKPKEAGVFQAPTAKSAPHQILDYYLDLPSLQSSEVWARLDIAKRTMLVREYVKRHQIQANALHQAQHQLEKHLEKEEQEKALAQTALQPNVAKKHVAFSLSVKLNEAQLLAVEYAKAGKSFVLTGPAGTGKTTACREMAKEMLERGDLGFHTFKIDGEKYTGPGIAFCSYTRRATSNIRRALHMDPQLEVLLTHNVLTIHKLLEFEPEFFVTAEGNNSMRFIPRRNARNLLDVRVIVIEEASMLGLDLYEKLFAAMRPGTILVFVGDINQLPPVFGKSIMNYALSQLPVVELTEVYRQALDSGIIQNAHRILVGQSPLDNKDTQIVTGTKKEHVGQEKMSRALGSMFYQLWDKGEYDPEQDIILSPWNKQPCGTDNLNNWIAQFLGEKREAMIHEVQAGRRKMYLAIGDRIMYEKQDGIITGIRHNADYLGKAPQPAGTDLTRFGMRKMAENAKHEDFEDMAFGYANINIDEVKEDEKKMQASHVVEITLDDGRKDYLRAIGDYAENVFSLGYVLTVHKSQGCEWRKVFVVLHKDHTLGGFLSRELLYTACTRAREKLILICKPDVLARCVKQQTIKGNTLQEKIASINSGAQNLGTYPVLKLKEHMKPATQIGA